MNSIAIYNTSIPEQAQADWVPESRFGRWFGNTNLWVDRILTDSVADLRYMIGGRLRPATTLLEAGCGVGHSFALLDQNFLPKRIVGLDIDDISLRKAAAQPRRWDCELELVNGCASYMEFADNSFDLVFCHQLVNRVQDQGRVLAELYRVLAPGGFLLCSESCRSFIEKFWVRLLFRHPRMEHRSAEEYVELLRETGFELGEHDVKMWAPWWSMADFGLWDKLGLPARQREPTQILAVARKPTK